MTLVLYLPSIFLTFLNMAKRKSKKNPSQVAGITDEDARKKASELILAGETIGTAEGLSDEMRDRIGEVCKKTTSRERPGETLGETLERLKREYEKMKAGVPDTSVDEEERLEGLRNEMERLKEEYAILKGETE